MNEKELMHLAPGHVLRLLRGQVDAAIGIVDSGATFKTKDIPPRSTRDILNFEVGDFRITARFTAPHD